MSDTVKLNVEELTLTGALNSAGVRVLIQDASGNALLAIGTTVPSSVAGYAAGGLFIDSDATGAARLLVNGGSTSSCTFTAVA